MWARWERVVAVLGAGLLLVGACGGGSSEGSEGGEVRVEAGGLGQAFAAAAEATTYRLTVSTGQTLTSSALGVDTKTKFDPDHPTVAAEVTPTVTHVRIDLAPILGPMLGETSSELTFEMWLEPDRLVFDSRGYAGLLKANPDADLGPFQPGVSYVDLTAASLDSPDMVAALVGQGMPDLRELATRLPAALRDVERDGDTFTGSIAYADLLSSMGSDLEQVVRSTAAGVSLNLDVDPEALSGFYLGYFEDIRAEMTVRLDDDGLVESVQYRVDLSGIYDRMFRSENPLGLDASDAELAEAARAFADTQWTIDSLMTFELVDDLDVDPVPDDPEDRTDAWVSFLRDAGF